jgi:hypothetical protein
MKTFVVKTVKNPAVTVGIIVFAFITLLFVLLGNKAEGQTMSFSLTTGTSINQGFTGSSSEITLGIHKRFGAILTVGAEYMKGCNTKRNADYYKIGATWNPKCKRTEFQTSIFAGEKMLQTRNAETREWARKSSPLTGISFQARWLVYDGIGWNIGLTADVSGEYLWSGTEKWNLSTNAGLSVQFYRPMPIK